MMIRGRNDLNQQKIIAFTLCLNQFTFTAQKISIVTQEHQPFKERYTIQDLESLSGIQAHTLRIWEKRYDLLHPMRAGNNVRYYSHQDLRKLLNIAALYHQGHKISRIASLPEAELEETVRKEMLVDHRGDFAGHSLRMAMLNYDHALFDQTIHLLLSQKTFREVCRTVFLPFLNDIGLMWQTSVITVAHEHFLSNLLRQKILYQIDQLHAITADPDQKVFVLFLPDCEVHEIGLLYAQYELMLHGCRTIYLGQSVPLESLSDLQTAFPAIIFVTSFTIHPQDGQVVDYLKGVSKNLLRKGSDELWVSGRKIHNPENRGKIKGIRYILGADEFIESIRSLLSPSTE